MNDINYMQEDKVESYENTNQFETELVSVLERDYGISLNNKESKVVSQNFTRLLNQFL